MDNLFSLKYYTGSNKNVVISVTSKENFILFSVLLHLDLKAKFCEVVVYFFSVYFYLYFFHNGVSCTIPLCWKYLLKIEGKNIKSESHEVLKYLCKGWGSVDKFLKASSNKGSAFECLPLE